MKPVNTDDKIKELQEWLEQSESIEIDPESLAFYEPSEPKTRYETDETGVKFIDVKTDEDGNRKEKVLRLCDELHILGSGADEQGKEYIITQYKSRENGSPKMLVLPQAEIGTPNCWRSLQEYGVGVMAGVKKRNYLSDYLQQRDIGDRYTVHHTTGWKGKEYLLPSGEFIKPTGETEEQKIVYIGDTSQAHEYRVSGSLKDWQENVAKYAAGNSRVLLALGTAFAAPLLRLANVENGGFHLFGDSGDGKTTSALIGNSVWCSKDGKESWNRTALYITNAACSRNDCFMFLDEIGEQKNLKDIAQAAYSLGNGENRGRADKNGKNKAVIKFKTLIFSTGEHPLDVYVKSGDPNLWNTGQSVRLPSLTANAGKGYGMFDTIHGFKDATEFAKHLNENTAQYYGIAGREFVAAVQADTRIIEKIEQYSATFENSVNADRFISQVRRVLQRFALVYAALELATQYGITGFQAGASLELLQSCFYAWLERNGEEKSEDRQICENFEDWFGLYSGNRFTKLDGESNPTTVYGNDTVSNHAGYVVRIDDRNEYYMTNAVFKEICGNFDKPKVVNVLVVEKMLVKGKEKDGRTWKNIGNKKDRFYRFINTTRATPATESESVND